MQAPKPIQSKLATWLVAEGSLTERLERLLGGQLGVMVVHEGSCLLGVNEKKQFGFACNKPMMAWCRTVYLYDKSCGFDRATALVQAVSVFPFVSLTGDAKRLKYLHGTPIGYVLFKKNRTLPCQRALFCVPHSTVVCRQNIYEWQGRKLLIQETFLPRLQALLDG